MNVCRVHIRSSKVAAAGFRGAAAAGGLEKGLADLVRGDADGVDVAVGRGLVPIVEGK